MPLPIDWSKLTPQDILDIAAFIEQEAQERYLLFADHLDRQGESEAAGFFRLMAELEGVHGAQVSHRRAARFADLPGHIQDAVEWDVEGPALDRNVSTLTIHDAFAMALASEERARDFFAEACDHLVDEKTRDMLAELHRDEVSHVQMLQEMRARLLPAPEAIPA
ncbi:MAG: ferritin family protein [Acidobacteriota bacterium]